MGNAGGGECGPLSLGYNGTRDRPGRSQTGERRADLIRFARENPSRATVHGLVCAERVAITRRLAALVMDAAHISGSSAAAAASLHRCNGNSVSCGTVGPRVSNRQSCACGDNPQGVR